MFDKSSKSMSFFFSSRYTELAYRSIGWELPGHVPFDATKKLVLDVTCQWREPSLSCFEDIHAMTLRKLDALIHEHFCQFPNAESHIRFVSSKTPRR